MTVYITKDGSVYESRFDANAEIITAKFGPHVDKPHAILGFWQKHGSEIDFEDNRFFYVDGNGERFVSCYADLAKNINYSPSPGLCIVARRFENGSFYRDGELDNGLYVSSPIERILIGNEFDRFVGQEVFA